MPLRLLVVVICVLAALPMTLHANPTRHALDHIRTAAEDARSDAVLVQHNGKVLLKAGTASADTPVALMSATKSVVALAVALLLDEGKLSSLDQPVSSLYPEWNQGQKRAITVRMLMDHTSGLQNVANAGVELEGAPDLVALALAAELSAEPGTVFSYNNKATNLLTGLVERVAGQPIDAYLQDRLFRPLGIADAAWMKDAAGTPMGMAGLSLSATDLARIGQLMLEKGVTPNGRRLISEAGIALLTAESTRSPEVGLLWWRIPAWERYTLKPDAATLLAAKGVATPVRDALLAAAGRTFGSRSELTGFIAEQLGPGWANQYGTEITARGMRLTDLFVQQRGPEQAYAANGFLGQHLVVVPEKGIVAVRQIQRREGHVSPRDDYSTFPADVLQLARTL